MQIARIPAPTTSYLDTGLNYSTVYYYQIWAYNGAGDSPLSGMAAFKTRPPDRTKPTLRVVSPVYNQRWNNAEFTVKGIARDNVKVSNVFYSLNGEVWSKATTSNNWVNWTAQLSLVPGTNHLWAYATDSTGNSSVTNGVNFVFVVTDRLEVSTSGLGAIAPNYNNARLELGRNYTIRAVPSRGFTFVNWLISKGWMGGVTTNKPVMTFMMQSNLTLQVNFADVTKPIMIITAPRASQHMPSALATIKGITSDNWKVAGVWYQLNDGDWSQPATADGWKNWMTTAKLQNDTNTIRAYAVDLGGNSSKTNTVNFVSDSAFKLQLAFPSTQPMAANGLNLTLQISPKLNGHVQVSTNLEDWVTLTSFVGTNTTINLCDATATNFNQRFYRAVVP